MFKYVLKSLKKTTLKIVYLLQLIVLTTLIAVSVAAELPYPSPTASYPAPAYSSYVC